MMRALLASLSFLIVLSLSAPIASAHVFLDDGVIDVFSHIEPDDDPIIASKADLFFIVTDKTNKFVAKECDCHASIKKTDGTVLFSTVIYKGPKDDEQTATFSYTFPQKGVYDLEITGKPTTSGAFQSFEVHRIIRVERTISLDQENGASTSPVAVPASSNSHNSLVLALFGLAFIAIVIRFAWEGRGKSGESGSISKSALIIAFAVVSLSSLFFHESHAMNLFDGMDCGDKHECCNAVFFSLPHASDENPIQSQLEKVTYSEPAFFYIQAFSANISNNSPPFLS